MPLNKFYNIINNKSKSKTHLSFENKFCKMLRKVVVSF